MILDYAAALARVQAAGYTKAVAVATEPDAYCDEWQEIAERVLDAVADVQRRELSVDE